MKPHSGGYTAAQREQALKDAEEHLVRPGPEDVRELLLRPDEITTHIVLFQPRAFLSARVGGKEGLNADWVKRLKGRIGSHGELDPVTVIQFKVFDWSGDDGKWERPQWVLVDGHHRHAAYQELGWKEPLRCIWFAGSAREAMDAAGQSSTELKLEASREDREEEVWKRVLIGGWAREELRKLFHVSPNLITHMRRVIRWYNNKRVRSTARREFRKQYPDLKDASWYEARLAFLGATPKERSDEQQMQALARRLRERFAPSSVHSLSRDPKITAGALQRYDRKLPEALTEEWETTPSAAVAAFRDAEAYADLEDTGVTHDGDAWGALEDPEEDDGNHGAAETSVEEGPRSVQNAECIPIQNFPKCL